MSKAYEEEKINTIIAELNHRNKRHAAAIRDPEKVRRDAEYIYMHRHEGVTVETLAMMLTDLVVESFAEPAEVKEANDGCRLAAQGYDLCDRTIKPQKSTK